MKHTPAISNAELDEIERLCEAPPGHLSSRRDIVPRLIGLIRFQIEVIAKLERLNSAAPELLEELKIIRDIAQSQDGVTIHHGSVWYGRLTKLIAKAEGRDE